MAQQKAVQISLTGAALVRLLEALADPRVRGRDARASFADGLVQWVGWADAIALSAALERPFTSASAQEAAFDERAECDRIRVALVRAAAREVATADVELGYPSFRRRYVAQQQTMETAIDALRERVRAELTARSPEMARLAAVDAVMAQALGGHERRLLGTVPGLLERHYKRLRDEHEGDEEHKTEDWVEVFRQDMKAVLLAELELRMQPVEGLLEALGKD